MNRFVGIWISFVWCAVAAAGSFDCLDLKVPPVARETFSQSPVADFAERDKLPQTEIDKSTWAQCCGSFGPCPLPFPVVTFPPGINRRNWSQERVLAAAKKYIALPYRHAHIPAVGGLDCSNFTAWVYNYALGIRFSSEIKKQAETAGRRLFANEALAPGDLIFLWREDHVVISHVAIYIDDKTVIDAAEPAVAVRAFSGRYRERFAWARRILE